LTFPNQSNFVEIEKLFDQRSTICVRDGAFYLGMKDIMVMQRIHHGSCSKLEWIVSKVEEVKPCIIRFAFAFAFDFEGTTQDSQTVKLSGVEFVVIDKGIIRHIDVRSQ